MSVPVLLPSASPAAFLSVASKACSLSAAWNILSVGVLVRVSTGMIEHVDQWRLAEEKVYFNL